MINNWILYGFVSLLRDLIWTRVEIALATLSFCDVLPFLNKLTWTWIHSMAVGQHSLPLAVQKFGNLQGGQTPCQKLFWELFHFWPAFAAPEPSFFKHGFSFSSLGFLLLLWSRMISLMLDFVLTHACGCQLGVLHTHTHFQKLAGVLFFWSWGQFSFTDVLFWQRVTARWYS